MPADETKMTLLTSLLRAELSAIQTYRHVLEKGKDETDKLPDLAGIERDHTRAANLIELELSAVGNVPSIEEPDSWTTVALIAEASGSPTHDPYSLKALKEGETQNAISYENAIKSEKLDAKLKGLIEGELLPKTQQHITVLDRMLQAA